MRSNRVSGAVLCLCLLGAADASAGNRTVDGTQNNLSHPHWGSAGVWLKREASGDHYADGMSMPTGADRPGPRTVSNRLAAQSASRLNDRDLTDFLWQWGQFLDHDLDLTSGSDPAEPFDIAVPVGDPFFDPQGTGTQTMRFDRSIYDPATGSAPGPGRQQVNEITAWIDASNVYGSDTIRATALRTHVGGRLKVTPHLTGDLLPFNTDGLPNAGGTGAELFLAGDVRANEQVGLTALHTLFVREHNRLADETAAIQTQWSDEQIYQRVRKVIGAQMQAITFNGFLPALLGPWAPQPESPKYRPDLDGSISSAFSTAAFRIGHTMLSGHLLRLDESGSAIPEGHLALRDAFFSPYRLTDEGGIEPLLHGLARQPMQQIDTQLVDDVRNFMFGPPAHGGLDLASMNIQRGRDHGLADYNTMRADFGLPRVEQFDQITSDPDLAAALEDLYGSVDAIDPWTGGLAEDHLPGSSMGELFTTVLVDQFTRLRDGDRYWYLRDPDLSAADINEIQATTLADIVRRNTGISQIQDNVFFMPEPGSAFLLIVLAGCSASGRRCRAGSGSRRS